MSQLNSVKKEHTRLGNNAGEYVVTEHFWRGVHNTSTNTVLLFPPDWENEAQPVFIQMDERDMPEGISADWREWSIGVQMGCNAQFVKSILDDPWYGCGEG